MINNIYKDCYQNSTPSSSLKWDQPSSSTSTKVGITSEVNDMNYEVYVIDQYLEGSGKVTRYNCINQKGSKIVPLHFLSLKLEEMTGQHHPPDQ